MGYRSNRSFCLCKSNPLLINCITNTFFCGTEELVGVCGEFEKDFEDWKEIFAPGLQTVPQNACTNNASYQ